MIIEVRKVADNLMPYDTVGDWRWRTNQLTATLVITIVDLGNPLYEWLLWRHEQDEALLCKEQGVTVEQVDEFDKAYEEAREGCIKVQGRWQGIPKTMYGKGALAPCGCRLLDEPGDDEHAPYNFAHTGAELNERQLATTLGVVWGDYIKAIDAAFERVRKARRG